MSIMSRTRTGKYAVTVAAPASDYEAEHPYPRDDDPLQALFVVGFAAIKRAGFRPLAAVVTAARHGELIFQATVKTSEDADTAALAEQITAAWPCSHATISFTAVRP